MSLFALAVALVPGVAASAQSAYVPAVVVSSVSAVPVPTLTKAELTGSLTNVVNPAEVMLDACGNIYTLDFGNNGTTGTTVTEIPANGGAASVVENVGLYYPTHIGQDPTRQNLIAGQAYGTGANLIPLINCVPQSASVHHVGGGSGALFYYYNPDYFAGDFIGNTYITTQATCCVTGSYYLVQEAGGNGNILLTNQSKVIQSLAIDLNQNVYFISGGQVFELPYSGGTAGTYPTTPIAFGTAYTAPVGISVDVAGNLYISDEGAAAIYEIPYEATAGGASALIPADQFIVATGINVAVAVAVDARGDIYYTPPNATAVQKLSLGNANFNSVALGQTATRTLSFQFNSSVTPASVKLPTGVFASKSGGNGSTPCTAGVTYSPTGTPQCTLTVTFTPTAVGKQSSAVILADAAGNSIATAYLEGIGQGASLTLDPGTVAPVGSGMKTPTGVAVDGAGNAYIADPAANAIVEFPAGGGAAVTLTVAAGKPGTDPTTKMPYPAVPISAANGVAVDGAGNVFIADTGNNRVVEVPNLSGALDVTSASIVADGFNAPASVFVHTNGDLYVTDTGNNTVVLYPSFGGKYGAPSHLGVGLLAPLATTVDAIGDVYIADSGNNQIVELPLGSGQETVAAGILNPSALATDSSGALFAVDQGNFRVLRIPSVQGILNPNTAAEVGLGIANPYGVALDANANLYVTDSTNAAAYMVDRSQVSLSFGTLGVASTSEPLPLTVESAGNLPLVFNTPYFAGTGNTGDFAMTSPTGACADGVTLGTGTSCDLNTTFMPTATGARQATLVFSSNAVTPAQVSVVGTGGSFGTTTTALALSVPSTGSPFYGQPLVFTAMVTGTSPSGSVSFVVDGVQVALLPLASGVATLPLNSGLAGGTHSIYAVYKGDSANDGSSSAPLAITIARAPTTATIVVNKVVYNNPFNIRHSNMGSCSVTEATGDIASFPAIPDDGVAFVASVASPGVGIPSGTLTFYSDGHLINSLSTASPQPASVSQLLPAAGGVFSGGMSSDADTLGDGTALGENNVLVGPHGITVVYSGDQNYLPSTSAAVVVTVVDVSPTTPVILPESPAQPAPYCAPSSPIAESRPAVPSTFEVQPSADTITASATAPGVVKLTLSSLGGYNGVVAVSCPDLPQYATCTLNPGQITVSPSKPGTSALPSTGTLTITTNVPPYVPTANQGLWWFPAGALGVLLLFSRRRFTRFRGALTLFGIAMVLVGGMAGLTGCGSGSSSSSSAVTKAGSYTVTVVLQGSQNDPYTECCRSNFRPDVPYPVKFTLIVK